MPGVKATARHAEVAKRFREWLISNRQADMREKVQKLNQLSDLEFMREKSKRK